MKIISQVNNFYIDLNFNNQKLDFSTILKKFDINNLNEATQTKLKKTLKQYVKNKDKDKVNIKFDDTEDKILERSENYKNIVKDITKYQERVKINREADIIDFTNIQKNTLSAKAISNNDNLNDMEKTIKNILVKNKYDTDEKIIQAENEKLLAINPEELQKRYDDLKKLKFLLFQQEMNNKRKSKIKSKLYHKIKKRQRDIEEKNLISQLEEVDPEGVKKYLENKKMDRIKERIELKHSTNSKFNKTVKKYNLQNDANVKEAIKENIKLRDELMKKIKGIDNSEDDVDENFSLEDNESDEGENYEDGEIEEDEEIDEDKILVNFNEDEKDKNEENIEKGVWGMKFMKNASTMESKLKDVLNEIKDSDEDISIAENNNVDEDEIINKPDPIGKIAAKRKSNVENKKQTKTNPQKNLTSDVIYYLNR